MRNKHLDLKIVLSGEHNPWYNLALEEYLLKHIKENQIILYLWQNKKTVVIGRNQNAWKECRCSKLEQEGGKLARRLSGGGAVFHDFGNLNFTFIVDRKQYNLEKQLEVILQAVKMQGINAEFSGRNDLVVNSKKFSGNAFYFSGQAAYHHGTILIDVNIEELVGFLQVSTEKITSKGITSVRSRVVNLKELKDNITIDMMIDSLKRSFKNIYGHTDKDIREEVYHADQHSEEIETLYQKYASWEWRYGDSPSFDVVFENRFSWGGVELGLNLKNGIVQTATIYSDAMNEAFIRKISSVLQGLPFKSEEISAALSKKIEEEEEVDMVKDMRRWLQDKVQNI